MDERALVPSSKGDLPAAKRAVAAGWPAVEPVLPELLEWIQDVNWPVAPVLMPFLASLGDPLVPHLRPIFAGRGHHVEVLDRFGLAAEHAANRGGCAAAGT